jgi:hypothetical protein
MDHAAPSALDCLNTPKPWRRAGNFSIKKRMNHLNMTAPTAPVIGDLLVVFILAEPIGQELHIIVPLNWVVG